MCKIGLTWLLQTHTITLSNLRVIGSRIHDHFVISIFQLENSPNA
jgi:hypothetical protein